MRPNEYDDLLVKIKCSNDFRKRMEEKLSSAPTDASEYEEIVRGTDVITPRKWGSFAAVAAACVLACGAVGGGTYYYKSRGDNKIVETASIEDIYSVVKSNVSGNNYEIQVLLKSDIQIVMENVVTGKDLFFGYMDNAPSCDSIDRYSVCETEKYITITFHNVSDAYSSDDVLSYSFIIYESGDCIWKEEGFGYSREYCYRFAEGGKVYNDIYQMYKPDDDTMNKVGDALKSNIVDSLEKYLVKEDEAVYRTVGDNQVRYRLVDRKGLIDEFSSEKWQMATGLYGNDIYDAGITISSSGYIEINIADWHFCYKLFDNSDDRFRTILEKHLIYDDFGSDASEDDINTINKALNELKDKVLEYRADGKELTDGVEYSINDPDGLKKEISALEWVTCESDAEPLYRDFYAAGTIISRNGYIKPVIGGVCPFAYKLKNEGDLEKFREICDRHFVECNTQGQAEVKDVIEKIKAGSESFSNVKGRFSIAYQPGSGTASFEGDMVCDKKNEAIYMKGTGKIYGMSPVMDPADFELAEMDHKIYEVSEMNRQYTYKPEYGSGEQNYLHLDRTVIRWLEDISSDNKKCSCETEELGNGITRYTVRRSKDNPDHFVIELDSSGRIIFFGRIMSVQGDYFPYFRLENYEFDSTDFDGSGIAANFEKMKGYDNIISAD